MPLRPQIDFDKFLSEFPPVYGIPNEEEMARRRKNQ